MNGTGYSSMSSSDGAGGCGDRRQEGSASGTSQEARTFTNISREEFANFKWKLQNFSLFEEATSIFYVWLIEGRFNGSIEYSIYKEIPGLCAITGNYIDHVNFLKDVDVPPDDPVIERYIHRPLYFRLEIAASFFEVLLCLHKREQERRYLEYKEDDERLAEILNQRNREEFGGNADDERLAEILNQRNREEFGGNEDDERLAEIFNQRNREEFGGNEDDERLAEIFNQRNREEFGGNEDDERLAEIFNQRNREEFGGNEDDERLAEIFNQRNREEFGGNADIEEKHSSSFE